MLSRPESDAGGLFAAGIVVGGLLVSIVWAFSPTASDVCEAAQAELERDCYYRARVCWCADGGDIVPLGGEP